MIPQVTQLLQRDHAKLSMSVLLKSCQLLRNCTKKITFEKVCNY